MEKFRMGWWMVGTMPELTPRQEKNSLKVPSPSSRRDRPRLVGRDVLHMVHPISHPWLFHELFIIIVRVTVWYCWECMRWSRSMRMLRIGVVMAMVSDVMPISKQLGCSRFQDGHTNYVNPFLWCAFFGIDAVNKFGIAHPGSLLLFFSCLYSFLG